MAARRGLIALSLTAALAAAGCGGSSSGSSDRASAGGGTAATGTGGTATGTDGTATTPSAAKPKASGGKHSYSTGKTTKAAQPDPVSTKPKVKVIPDPLEKNDSETPKAANVDTQHNACSLVSKSTAASIVGRPIAKVSEAPQGPTCVYQPSGGKQFVTVAVETTKLAIIQARSKAISKTKVNGRAAYCVKYGGMMMYVPLSGGRMLHVTAACPVASRFASAALTTLG
jgi:hypothetical protein